MPEVNISRRSFFRRFSSSDTAEKALDNANPTTPSTSPGEGRNLPRRDVLKLGATVGTLALAESILPGCATGRVFRGEEAIDKERERELDKTYEYWNKFLDAFLQEIEQQFGPIQDRTGEEREQARNQFMRTCGEGGKFGENFQEFLRILTQVKKFEMFISYTYAKLSQFDCQGLLYQEMRSAGTYKDVDMRIVYNERKKNHFSTRAIDFLPTADELRDEEIDPRMDHEYFLGKDTEPSYQKSLEENLAMNAGWADKERLAYFRSLLSNPNIRTLFEKTDYNLAEVYSMIKATIKFRIDNPKSGQSDEMIVRELMKDKNEFDTRVLLSPDTDQFIHFNYWEGSGQWSTKTREEISRFDGGELDDIAVLCGVKPDAITRIDGPKDKNDPEKNQDIFRAISESRGKTTIFFNTHGLPSQLDIRKARHDDFEESDSNNRKLQKHGEIALTVSALSRYLIERLSLHIGIFTPLDGVRPNGGPHSDGKDTKDTSTLGEVTLILDSCYSYDFTKNLIDELKKMYSQPYTLLTSDTDGTPITRQSTLEKDFGCDFSQIKLPTIVTATQEGSFGFDGYDISSNLFGN